MQEQACAQWLEIERSSMCDFYVDTVGAVGLCHSKGA